MKILSLLGSVCVVASALGCNDDAAVALRGSGPASTVQQPYATSPEAADAIAERSADGRLKTAMMGALLFLDDTQIRPRKGWLNPIYDACGVGDGCFPMLPGTGQSLPLPLPRSRNLAGEWANWIHIYPDLLSLLNDDNESVVQIQDSNLFMAAAVSYPMYLFDESSLSEAERVVTQMRTSATANIRAYKRETAYSFWPVLKGSTSDEPRVGPLNIPMAAANLTYILRLFPDAMFIKDEAQREWMFDALDKSWNPAGLDALANIPNDADDSAVASAAEQLAHWNDGGPAAASDTLDTLLAWRDLERAKEDGRDAWKSENSGAFLTWLKDESLDRSERFREPQTGVMPLGVNNVDCVVNANVLLAMGLAGRTDDPAVLDASEVMLEAVASEAWPECGLYYPQRMIFPYTAARAFRDGKVDNPPMRDAMTALLAQLIEDQQEVALAEPDRTGSFGGGADPTADLSTALALSALLNLGLEVAQQADLVEEYELAVADAVEYLLASQSEVRIRFRDTFNRDGQNSFFPSFMDTARRWDSGVYFAASAWSLAQWRSDPYTAAIALEALTKYLLAYDHGGVDIRGGRRIRVESYARNSDRATRDLRFEIR